MFINKNLSLRGILRFTGMHLLCITIYASCVAGIFAFTHWTWMAIPWLPLSVIGTAVAFYVGFKNNQAYDRLWEARKIWGGIINSSRAWGSMVNAFITDQFSNGTADEETLSSIKKTLVFRHIGWLYALRSQLLIPTPWEHISQGYFGKKKTQRMMKNFGVGLLDDGVTVMELKEYLPKEEYEELINYKNTATQIINKQSQELMKARQLNIIEDFRHMEMQNILNEFYDLQGKCERIKKFPLPRQYGGMSSIFVWIFVILIPFGMAGEFHNMGEMGHWMSIPFSVLVSWIFISMELVGDYSENPFEGLGNDIPMLSLCRVIEIDLIEMTGFCEVPPPIKAVNGVLM